MLRSEQHISGSRQPRRSRIARWCGQFLVVAITVPFGWHLALDAPGVPLSDPALMHPPRRLSPPACWKLLNLALDRALQEDDPRISMANIASTAHELDSRRALDLVRRMVDVLDKRSLSSAPSKWREEWNSYAHFAYLAAWHDLDLRDRCLMRAVAEAEIALVDDARWQPRALLRGQEAWQDPKVEMKQTKLLYAYSAEMWQCVLEHRQNAQAARDRLRHLLFKADAQGWFGSCVQRKYDVQILKGLCQLDSALLLAVQQDVDSRVAQHWQKEVAQMQAHRRRHNQAVQRSPDKDRPKAECKTEIAMRDARAKMTAEEQAAWRASHWNNIDPDVQRVLDRPRDTGWLQGERRQSILNHAAASSYLPGLEIGTIKEIVAGMNDPMEIDQLLRETIGSIVRWGKVEHVFKLLQSIKSTYIFVDTCCIVARQISKAADEASE